MDSQDSFGNGVADRGEAEGFGGFGVGGGDFGLQGGEGVSGRVKVFLCWDVKDSFLLVVQKPQDKRDPGQLGHDDAVSFEYGAFGATLGDPEGDDKV